MGSLPFSRVPLLGVPEKIPYREAFVKMSFYISIHLEGLLNDLMGSMGLIYLPTTKQINYINVGKYTVRPMDPLGIGVKLISIGKNYKGDYESIMAGQPTPPKATPPEIWV